MEEDTVVTEVLEMQQVHGNAMEPGTWVEATYGDTPPRVVYMCDCGKVNAIDGGRVNPDRVVVDAAGLSDEVACEGKACAHKHTLRFLESTAEEMDAHREAKLLREASELALQRGVTAESLVAASDRIAAATAYPSDEAAAPPTP